MSERERAIAVVEEALGEDRQDAVRRRAGMTDLPPERELAYTEGTDEPDVVSVEADLR